MKGGRLLLALAAFSGLGPSACSPTSGGRDAPRVRELDEIPIAQLRVLLKGYPGDWRAAGELNSRLPEPPVQKPTPPGARCLPLPAPGDLSLGTMPVRDAIASRRSVRQFSGEQLSLEELGFLLWATQGVTAVEKDDSGNILRRYRAAPSAGGRHPLETYLAVRRVAGLSPGLYRYLPSEHQLLLLREDAALSEHLGAACYDTSAAKDAAVVFIWSATPFRTEWKYAFLAHRMIAMEAGHVCQNLYLAAESCRIGACALLSYHQPLVDRLLGLDGVDEFAVYLACIGKAVEPAP